MSHKVARRWDRVVEAAARQHGVISSTQLLQAGLDRNAVWYRTQVGLLHRVHRGVYAVGHPGITTEGRWMAAVLACGGYPGRARSSAVLDRWRAALSHRSAASLWDLLDRSNGAVEVTIPGDGGRTRRRGIRLHRSGTLSSSEVTIHRGIPVTKPARTIEDLRRLASSRSSEPIMPSAELRRAVRKAEVLGLATGARWRDGTRSELERRFLRLCIRHRLPAPEVNVKVNGYEVDFLWRTAKLIVETDGYRYHRGRAAFESDRERDLALRGAGLAVIRLTHGQILNEPERIVTIVNKLISGPGSAAD